MQNWAKGKNQHKTGFILNRLEWYVEIRYMDLNVWFSNKNMFKVNGLFLVNKAFIRDACIEFSSYRDFRESRAEICQVLFNA